MKHKSVLLDESIEMLKIREDGVYVDATLGFGGHSLEILKRIKKGFLFAFDQDSEAIKYSEERLKDYHNFKIIKSNFANMKECLNHENVSKVDGILFDIGVSSMQLDEDYRGFSYHNDAKLDMRMNQKQELSAYEVVNNYPKDKLIKVFYEYGEEKFSKSIAEAICKYRENKPIETTLELAEIIKSSVPEKYRRLHHPARKVFQAIRIEVNDELNVLQKALNDSLELLNPGGRLCVITFHSLEDRIVKNTFKEVTKENELYKGMPNIPDEYKAKYKLIGKFKPTKEELENNNRSRSAILRVIERI